jgi:hypothetical protein
MNTIYEHFIGIYENAFSAEYCANAIKYFEDMEAAGFTKNRQVAENANKTHKDDTVIYCHDQSVISMNGSGKLTDDFNSVFWHTCYRDYADNFAVLKDLPPHNSYYLKIQKTKPGQGYLVWHFESDCRKLSNRLLVWSLYLNDVEEGGETEFLYLNKRIKPKTGTLLIWPAGFTHTHRGNPPLSGVKYIITGWVEF